MKLTSKFNQLTAAGIIATEKTQVGGMIYHINDMLFILSPASGTKSADIYERRSSRRIRVGREGLEVAIEDAYRGWMADEQLEMERQQQADNDYFLGDTGRM